MRVYVYFWGVFHVLDEMTDTFKGYCLSVSVAGEGRRRLRDEGRGVPTDPTWFFDLGILLLIRLLSLSRYVCMYLGCFITLLDVNWSPNHNLPIIFFLLLFQYKDNFLV